jgi:hypothetical protein
VKMQHVGCCFGRVSRDLSLLEERICDTMETSPASIPARHSFVLGVQLPRVQIVSWAYGTSTRGRWRTAPLATLDTLSLWLGCHTLATPSEEEV